WAPEYRGGRTHTHAVGWRFGDCPGGRRACRTAPQRAVRDLSVEDGHRGAVHDFGLTALRVDRACRKLHGPLGAVLSHSHEQEWERRAIMLTLKWSTMRLVVMTLALLSATALPARGEVVSNGPKVGQWKTWVLASGFEISVPAPPIETSDQTKAE